VPPGLHPLEAEPPRAAPPHPGPVPRTAAGPPAAPRDRPSGNGRGTGPAGRTRAHRGRPPPTPASRGAASPTGPRAPPGTRRARSRRGPATPDVRELVPEMQILVAINDWLWNPLVVLALGLGLTFTMLTRGVQFRLLPEMIRQIRSGKSGGSDAGEGLSPFQALMLTLSSRIGVGNIAGVATAIAAGGPGALVWMAVMALVGATLAFVESTLAQIYKRKVDGRLWGGIPYYIERGLGRKWLAAVAAATALSLYGLLAPGIQAHNITAAVHTATGVSPWISGAVITAAFAYIVFGGRKRIVAVADTLVPVMAVGYIVAAVVVLAANAPALPGAVWQILTSAFGAHAVFGGIVGSAVAWGVRRALFSNVAGVGEGTYGSAAADVSHPVKQGLVQGFSIYIDTLFVCMATGLMIVVTGSFNVQTADGRVLAENLPGTEAGPAYTQEAVGSVLSGAGPGF